jgi:hypothetical protein
VRSLSLGRRATPTKEIQDLYLEGKKDAAARAILRELVDAVSPFGSREHVTERLRLVKATGVDTIIVTPATPRAGGRIEQLRQLADAAAEL